MPCPEAVPVREFQAQFSHKLLQSAILVWQLLELAYLTGLQTGALPLPPTNVCSEIPTRRIRSATGGIPKFGQ